MWRITVATTSDAGMPSMKQKKANIREHKNGFDCNMNGLDDGWKSVTNEDLHGNLLSRTDYKTSGRQY
jgi:hypothetical protein